MSRRRVEELDSLRGLAAIAVLLFHYSFGFANDHGFVQPQPYSFRLGYLGVHLFFIISGFVIFLTLDRTETALDFVASRASRLYPAFWIGVVFTTLVVGFTKLPGAARTPGEILVNLTMLQEFLGVQAVEGVYWTLTCELVFYALALIAFTLRQHRRALRLCYSWLFFQLLAIVIEHQYGYFPWRLQFCLLTEYCHLFVAGIVFYHIYQETASPSWYALLLLVLLNQFLLPGRDRFPASRIEEGICVAGFIFLMYMVVMGRAKWLRIRPLIFLGTISYSLYLTHQTLGYAILRSFDRQGLSLWAGTAIAMSISIAIATLITFRIERPVSSWMRTKHRSWSKSRRS